MQMVKQIKLSTISSILTFYMFNIIVVYFFYDIYQKQSLNELIIFGATLLAVIGVLAGLCYAGAPCNNTDFGKKLFTISGHRFLHCFITLIFALFFIGTFIHIKTDGFLGFNNDFLKIAAAVILVPLSILSLLSTARSFSVGYHMLKKILDDLFPFEDTKLFKDLQQNKEI